MSAFHKYPLWSWPIFQFKHRLHQALTEVSTSRDFSLNPVHSCWPAGLLPVACGPAKQSGHRCSCYHQLLCLDSLEKDKHWSQSPPRSLAHQCLALDWHKRSCVLPTGETECPLLPTAGSRLAACTVIEDCEPGAIMEHIGAMLTLFFL